MFPVANITGHGIYAASNIVAVYIPGHRLNGAVYIAIHFHITGLGFDVPNVPFYLEGADVIRLYLSYFSIHFDIDFLLLRRYIVAIDKDSSTADDDIAAMKAVAVYSYCHARKF